MAGEPKSRLVYILLAVFLGEFGVHNFYAGYTNKGIVQLVVSLFTWVGSIPMWIWAVIEALTVKKDAQGNDFA